MNPSILGRTSGFQSKFTPLSSSDLPNKPNEVPDSNAIRQPHYDRFSLILPNTDGLGGGSSSGPSGPSLASILAPSPMMAPPPMGPPRGLGPSVPPMGMMGPSVPSTPPNPMMSPRPPVPPVPGMMPRRY